jgi:methyl-accepting chemotaxis protein
MEVKPNIVICTEQLSNRCGGEEQVVQILGRLTFVWCGLMVVVCLYKRWTLGKPMRSLKDEIRRFRSKVPDDLRVDLESLTEISGFFEECPVLGECWQQYLKATASPAVRHLPPVTPYFSYQYLVDERGLRRDNETMPGAFTGYGILGTFVGLVLGLGQMNVADAVAIRGSINVLISGMSMAFLTSIAGVILSLLWTAMDQRLLRSTTTELEGLHDTLNRLVPSPSEWDLLEDLATVQREQLVTFNSFVTDTLIPEMLSGLREVLKDTLSPQLERTTQLFERVTTAGAEVQVEGMGNMVRMFVENLNRLLKGQVEDLSRCIKETITWQKQTHDEMQELSRGLSEAVLDVRDTLAQTADLVQDLSTEGQQLKAIIASLGSVQNAFETALSKLSQTIEATAEASLKTESNLQKLADASLEVDEAREKQFILLKGQLDEMKAFWRTAADQMNGLRQGITEGVQTFTQQLHQGLEYSFGQYDKALSTAVERLRGAISSLGDGMEDLPDLMDRIGERLVKLSSSVEAVIQGMNEAAATSLSNHPEQERR